MSLFGKILVVLNALTAIAFLVLAGLDYGKRQSWAYAVFRQQLAINGLPLDDKDDFWRLGSPIARDLSPNTLKDLFKAGGGPNLTAETGEGNDARLINTQELALEDAKRRVLKFVDEQASDKDKRAAIARVRIPLVKQPSDRETRTAAIADPKFTVDQLRADLAAQYDDAINDIKRWVKSRGPAESDRQSVPENERPSPDALRITIAHLLYHSNPAADPLLRERTQAAVGVEAYAEAVNQQAAALSKMVAHLQNQLTDEQGAFVRQHDGWFPQLAALNDQLKADAARLDTAKKALEANNLLLQARRAERDELRGNLQKLTEDVNAQSASLARVQQQLFAVQRDLAARRAGNEDLETQIRKSELNK